MAKKTFTDNEIAIIECLVSRCHTEAVNNGSSSQALDSLVEKLATLQAAGAS
jgi:hypothetical protein